MNCDPLARWYRWLEYCGMGRALERRRFEFLPELSDARRVLMLGEGDGRFLAAFLRLNAGAEVDYVDSSRRMLALAKRRAEAAISAPDADRRVHFHHADALAWTTPPGVAYDLVTAHFFLDCFTTGQLAPLLDRLSAVSAPRARWIVSEFHQPARGLAAGWAWLWITGLYAFFRVATGLRVSRLPEYRPLLQRLGFRRERVVMARTGLLVSERWRRP